MLKQNLQATIPFAAKGTLTAMLELYRFEENGVHIAYCPSLDLSAAGQTFGEATKEFEGVFLMHMEDCVALGTLHEDLIAHGWRMTSKAFNAPKATVVIQHNSVLRDIVNNRTYRRELRGCKLPRCVSQAMAAI